MFASEQIELTSDGMSNILIDIIIKNKSDSPTNIINILYPKSFLNTTLENGKPTFQHLSDAIEDYTHTVLDNKSVYNNKYNFGNHTLSIKPSGDTKSQWRMEFGIPNYTVPYKEPEIICCDIKDTCASSTENAVGLSEIYETDGCQYSITKLLHQNRFSIYAYKFKTPVQKNENRFIRLKLGPYRSVLHANTPAKELMLDIFNLLYFRYEIVSPYDVLHRFICKTYLTINNASKPFTDGQKNAFNTLLSFIDTLRQSKTTYNIWKLSIIPNSLKLISDLTLTGNIKILGSLPNENQDINDEIARQTYSSKWNGLASRFIQWKNRFFPHTIRHYDFITTNNDVPWTNETADRIEELDHSNGFRMFFSCRPSSYVRTVASSIPIVFAAAFILFLLTSDSNTATATDGFLNRNTTVMAAFTTFIAVPFAECITITAIFLHRLRTRAKRISKRNVKFLPMPGAN